MPAGEDGLGDMVIDTAAPRAQQFDSLDLSLSQIKKVETDKGVIKLKLADQEITQSPTYLPTYTPVEGPQARRFAITTRGCSCDIRDWRIPSWEPKA